MISLRLVARMKRMERRIGLYPAGFDADGVPYTRTELGDLPITLPAGPRDHAQDDVYEAFAAKLAEKVKGFKVGAGTEPGVAGSSRKSAATIPPPVARASWEGYVGIGLPLVGRAVSPGWAEVGRFLGPSIRYFWRRWPLERLLEAWRDAGREERLEHEQPAGRDWRQFHQVTLRWIGAIVILGFAAAILIFYLVRGMVRIQVDGRVDDRNEFTCRPVAGSRIAPSGNEVLVNSKLSPSGSMPLNWAT